MQVNRQGDANYESFQASAFDGVEFIECAGGVESDGAEIRG
jgi:hypothetical protein